MSGLGICMTDILLDPAAYNPWSDDQHGYADLNSKQDFNTETLGNMLRKGTSGQQALRDTSNTVLQGKILAEKLINVYAYVYII